MDHDLLWTLLVAATMLLGLFGVVIPMLPGLFLIWVAIVVYGWAVGFGLLGVMVSSTATALLVLSVVLSVVLPKRHAAAAGASQRALLAGALGAVVGFFAVPLVGVLLGAVAGVLGFELWRLGDWTQAWVATKGLLKGFGFSVLIDLCLGGFMIGLWSVWALAVLF